MSFIYRRASEVIIWLGSHPRVRGTQKATTWIIQQDWDSLPSRVEERHQSSGWALSVPWLYEVMHADYWKRAWVIQEIGEAVTVSVRYGSYSLPWSAFYAAVEAYRNKFTRAHYAQEVSKFGDLRKARLAGQTYSLPDLLIRFQNTFCKLPHDKIYAFLGMTSDDSANLIEIEYEKSLAQLYANVVRFFATSSLEREANQLGVVHMSALVRQVLVREKVDAVVTHRVPATIGPTKRWGSLAQNHKTTCWRRSSPELMREWTNHKQSITVEVKGFLTDRIESFGPSVDHFIGSITASRAWKADIMRSFEDRESRMRMLALYENLHDLVSRQSTTASVRSTATFKVTNVSARRDTPGHARLFVGSGECLGIASPQARIRDQIVQFLGSQSMALVRPTRQNSTEHAYTVHGRCSIVQGGYSAEWYTPHNQESNVDAVDRSVKLIMDLDTLTSLTLDSLTLDGEVS
ncbi:hypothetical protein RBB50_004210 [Rhinocladiella similis]